MESEKIQVKLMKNRANLLLGELQLFEEDPSDKAMVLIELKFEEIKISCISENFFDTLIELRKELDKLGILIMCNGAAENVYPSPMQQSMGTGRVAYKLKYGQKTKITDVVDIFKYDETLNFVNVDKQFNFYLKWVKSITE